MRRPHEVLVVVRRGAEFLIVHRAPRYDAYWHLVAGGVEQGESAAEAAARELREETGLDAPVVDLGRRFTYPLADESEAVRSRFAPDAAEVLVDCFLAEAPQAWEPTLNHEHDAFRWCSPAEAGEHLHWPEPREVLPEVADGSM